MKVGRWAKVYFGATAAYTDAACPFSRAPAGRGTVTTGRAQALRSEPARNPWVGVTREIRHYSDILLGPTVLPRLRPSLAGADFAVYQRFYVIENIRPACQGSLWFWLIAGHTSVLGRARVR